MRVLRFASVLLILFLLLVLPRPAAAAVSVRYQINFGGNQLFGNQWNSINVIITNSTATDLEGSVELSYGGLQVRDVFVQAGREVSVRFYLPPAYLPHFFTTGQASDVSVIVRNHQGREVAKSTITQPGSPAFSTPGYIGVLTGELTSFQSLSSLLSGSVVELNQWHLENINFMENFKVLIFSDAQGATLDSRQKENLEQWVANGGLLLLGGGTRWQQNQALVPTDLLPMIGTGLVTLPAGQMPLLDLPGEASYTIVSGTVAGEVLYEAEGIPVVTSLDYHRGVVVYSGLDLEAAPLNQASNFNAYVLHLLQRGLARVELRQPAPATWSVAQVFNNLAMDSVAMGPLSPLAGFAGLVGYIILAGPVNFLVLRKLKRWGWAWLTIPLLALLFTGAIFAAGSSARSSDLMVYQLNFVDMKGEKAWVISYSGVFVPRQTDYTLSVANYDVIPLGAISTRTLPSGTVLQLNKPPLWSIQRFYLSGPLDVSGPINVYVVFQDGEATVQVENLSGITFDESYIRLGGKLYDVGPLQAGDSRTIVAKKPAGIDGAMFRRQQAYAPLYELESLLPTGLVFFGFSDDDNLIIVEGVDGVVAASIVSVEVPLENISWIGEVNIPSGFLTPSIAGMSSRRGPYEYGPEDHVVEGQGSFDLVFQLPGNIDPDVGNWELEMGNVWGDAQGKMLLYNHHLDRWEELDTLAKIIGRAGVSRYVLDDMSLLTDNNRLLLRVEYDGLMGLPLSGISLTVQGGGTR